MPTPRQPETTELDVNQQKFFTALEEAELLSSKLSKDVVMRGKGVQDLDMSIRIQILNKLSSLVTHLIEQKSIISGLKVKPDIAVTKSRFYQATNCIKKIITTISALNIATESTFQLTQQPEASITKKMVDAFDKEMLEIEKAYNELRTDILCIIVSEFSRTASIYLTYFTAFVKGVTTVFLAWKDGLNRASQTTGSIFYPISALCNTITAFFGFCTRGYQWVITRTKLKKIHEVVAAQRELERAKLIAKQEELRESILFRFLIFTLHGLSILAFAGILSTPLGWVFVAAATLVDWIDNRFGGHRRAKAGLCTFLSNNQTLIKAGYADNKGRSTLLTGKDVSTVLEEVKNRDKACGSPEVRDIINELKSFLPLQEKVDKTKTARDWGTLSVISMILIACGPIPGAGPLLGLAGLAVMGIDVAANAKPYLDPYLEKWFGGHEVAAAGEKRPSFNINKALGHASAPRVKMRKDDRQSEHSHIPRTTVPRPASQLKMSQLRDTTVPLPLRGENKPGVGSAAGTVLKKMGVSSPR